MAKQKDFSVPKIGMNRSLSPHLLSEGEFSFQLNGNSYDEGGEKFNLTDEHSNILATRFKEGFKFVGGKNHVVRNKTYIFLANPATGVSEIGVIENKTSFSTIDDTEVERNCKDCPESVNKEATPLEEQTQVAHQVYETLLEDSCNLCLGFDIDHPIIDILIKEQNIGTKIFWTSTPGKKEFRFLELDNLDKYRVTGDENCGEQPTSTCIDCEKLRVFRLYSELKITDYSRTLGGNLKKGSYEVLGAYSDQLGNEYTSYTQLTPNIPIFDEANIIHEQEDNNAPTNFAIKIELEKPDTRFDFYKIAVRYYTSKGVFVSFVEGIHGTSNNVIIISDNNGISISNTKLATRKPFIETVDGATASNSILILNGVKEREPINLQPVINLAGLGVRWMSFRAKEDLYANADSYKYIGYNRDENLMFSVDFGFKDGFRTNPFIFVPRPPTSEETGLFNSGDDYDSISNVVGDCDGNIRTQKWQYYNTATVTGVCPAGAGTETVLQNEVISAYTNVTVPSAPSGSVTISEEDADTFTNLKTFIAENLDNCGSGGSSIVSICPFVDLTNLAGLNTTPATEANCSAFTLESESILIDAVNNEISTKNLKSINSYSTVNPPIACNIYQVDRATSDIKIDTNFAYEFNVDSWDGSAIITTKYRNTSVFNLTCNSALTLVPERSETVSSSQLGSFYHLNKGADTIAGLQTTKNVSAVSGSRFTSNLHEGALWFKTKVSGRESFFVELSKQSDCEGDVGSVSEGSEVRVSFFDSCSSSNSFHSVIVDLNTHNFVEVTNTMINALTNENIYVAVDVPIVPSLGYGEGYTAADLTSAPTAKYRLAPLCGCFNMLDREKEIDSITISYDSIEISKRQKYTSDCVFEVPVLKDCEPVPHVYGEMGYYESTDKYPDNAELYDSSYLTINKSRITNPELLEKLNIYKENETAEQILLSSAADFRCQFIRAYKFPDNKISPFIRAEAISSNAESIISPIGMTIDGEVINNLLDVAVDNNLITQEQRDDILDYKIYRSDLTLDRSVVASGIVFNSKKYTVDGEDINYFNYPFNSLGKDKYFPSNTDNDFNNIQAISPEFDYFAPSLPNEMSLQGFMFGNSNSRVLPVEEHAKMVILGERAKKLANTLAILESVAEGFIATAQSAEVWRVGFGFSNSVNPFGIGLNLAVAGLQLLGAIVFKVGRYRLEWLRTFENLGTPYNFGSYIAAGSNYNYLKPLQTDGDRLRGLSVRKYLKSGMLNVSDTTTGKILKINNLDREDSAFFSLGDYPINNLNSEYTSFDNSDLNPQNSSQVLSSELDCSKGKSPEVSRNVASPYVAFKNYIPNQYGTVDSIKWVDTTYLIDISETGVCNGVLGGDTFISRHSKKRKVRIFETDLLGSADLTPFPYKFNANYGDPRYYIDYKVNSEFKSSGEVFPDIFYDVKFDCAGTNNTFYVEPPGKFYLYSISYTNFLCETRVNTNFRNARKEPWNQFYPQNTDYEAISQPATVSLTRPESFFYNKAYLQTNVANSVFILPEFYAKENEAKKSYNVNSGIYSLPDVNENSITEPWLLYRPNDKFTLESRFGNLINIKGIESDQLLMYYEDAIQIQNSVNPFTDGSTSYSADLGNGGIFAKRATTLRSTDIGYGGTQSKQTLSCEFGHFHVDIKRGQVFSFNGKNLEEVSRYSGGKPNGMDVWFKEHLPYKLEKKFNNIVNKDNPYNGIGIHWGYDSKYRRVILTKKDYLPLNDCIEYIEGRGFVLNKTKCGEGTSASCPTGYTFNEATSKCEKNYTLINLCPEGYTYNSIDKKCVKVVTATPIFITPEIIDIAQPSCSIAYGTFKIVDFNSESTYTFTPAVSEIQNDGLVLANPGSYTFTETDSNGCISLVSNSITINTQPVVTATATPSSLTVTEGDQFTVELTSNLSGTTFNWTVVQSGVTGGTSGTGNTIIQTLTGTGTATYTVTPYNAGIDCYGESIIVAIQTETLVIDNNTEINIWFDNSGSMNTTLAPLNTMRDTVLKGCLLAAYNDDQALYDQRVNVYNFNDIESQFDGETSGFERYIHLLSKPVSTGLGANKVINLCFADESDNYGAGANWGNNVTAIAETDVLKLRSRLESITPNSLLGVVFQVSTGGVGSGSYPGFKNFVTSLHTGTAPFSNAPVKLSDKTEITYKIDVVPAADATYYANTIIDALNNLGFNLPPC